MAAGETNNGPFQKLFREFKDRTFDYALSMLGDRDAAGDITQEVFLRLFEKRDNGSDIANPENWLFIVARNLCLNRLRDSKRLTGWDGKGDGLEGAPSPDLRHITLRRAMSALDPEFREALILKEYQGFSYQQIAEITGRSVPAIRALLYKSRLRLRDEYEKISKME